MRYSWILDVSTVNGIVSHRLATLAWELSKEDDLFREFTYRWTTWWEEVWSSLFDDEY